MGCTYAKTFEFEQKPKRGRLRALFGRDHKRTKVKTIHIGDPVGVAVNKGTPMLNLERKTEQTVLNQLREEGIIPTKGSGGVAFTTSIDMKEEIPGQTASDDGYNQLPGVPQYQRDIRKTVHSRPRTLPPLTSRSILNKMSTENRKSDAEFIQSEELRRKGRMARRSEHRRELAAAKREAREKEKRERFEAKMMKMSLQKDSEIDKVKIDNRIERARINREMKEEENRIKVEENFAKVSRKEIVSKPSTEERLERARKNREKRLAEIKQKLEKKEKRIDEMKRSQSLNTSNISTFVPNMEV